MDGFVVEEIRWLVKAHEHGERDQRAINAKKVKMHTNTFGVNELPKSCISKNAQLIIISLIVQIKNSYRDIVVASVAVTTLNTFPIIVPFDYRTRRDSEQTLQH